MRKSERYAQVTSWFSEHMPEASTELQFGSTFQLLVAVMLSAQCTDRRVNLTTPALFGRFPDSASMARADRDELFGLISGISYPNSKTDHIIAAARMLEKEFGGQVPSDPQTLMRLPGVGRKTANVVASVAFGKEVMPVDTHVFRVARRIGLATSARTPLDVEMQLTSGFRHDLLPLAHHWLILHGRYVCTARKPHCGECPISGCCRRFSEELRKAARKEKDKKEKACPQESN